MDGGAATQIESLVGNITSVQRLGRHHRQATGPPRTCSTPSDPSAAATSLPSDRGRQNRSLRTSAVDHPQPATAAGSDSPIVGKAEVVSSDVRAASHAAPTGRLVSIDVEHPHDANRPDSALVGMCKRSGDVIRDMPALLHSFGLMSATSRSVVSAASISTLRPRSEVDTTAPGRDHRVIPAGIRPPNGSRRCAQGSWISGDGSCCSAATMIIGASAVGAAGLFMVCSWVAGMNCRPGFPAHRRPTEHRCAGMFRCCWRGSAGTAAR